MDIFPTILESLGATIQGSRLGLGTSLYSETPTLIELLGYDELNRQMSYTSKFYNEVIMSGDESKMPKKREKRNNNRKKNNKSFKLRPHKNIKQIGTTSPTPIMYGHHPSITSLSITNLAIHHQHRIPEQTIQETVEQRPHLRQEEIAEQRPHLR